MASSSFATSLLPSATATTTSVPSTRISNGSLSTATSNSSDSSNTSKPNKELIAIIAIIASAFILMGMLVYISILWWRHQERRMAAKARAKAKAKCIEAVELEAETAAETVEDPPWIRLYTIGSRGRAELDGRARPAELEGDLNNYGFVTGEGTATAGQTSYQHDGR